MSELDPDARALVASARVAHLATADQYARPHNVPIVFVLDGGMLYFPLDRKPKRDDDWHMLRRVRNIETNGRVAVIVDRYDDDWTKLAWVLLEGVATILESGTERDAAARSLAAKYVQYAAGGLDGRPVVRVTIERTVAWRARGRGTMRGMQEPLTRLDDLMRRLVESDQTGRPMEPLAVADELGKIRLGLIQTPAVLPRQGGDRHFRCDACGTIVHGQRAPSSCPTCGKTKFYPADLENTASDAGPG